LVIHWVGRVKAGTTSKWWKNRGKHGGFTNTKLGKLGFNLEKMEISVMTCWQTFRFHRKKRDSASQGY
jgi:hypothetical protein